MKDEADLQYLRNINTKPGPNAGRSIDPTKPGPDDDAEPIAIHDAKEQTLSEAYVKGFEDGRAQSDAEPVVWQIRTKFSDGEWTLWLSDRKPNLDPNFYEVRPLGVITQSDTKPGPDDAIVTDESNYDPWLVDDTKPEPDLEGDRRVAQEFAEHFPEPTQWKLSEEAKRQLEEIERLVKRNIEVETALDKIEAICKHGPDAND